MKRSQWILCLSVVGLCRLGVNGNDFEGFDDNNLFSLNWPGSDLSLLVSCSLRLGFLANKEFAGNSIRIRDNRGHQPS